jgi:hypothetical protein
MKSQFQIVVFKDSRTFKRQIYAHLKWQASEIGFHNNCMWIINPFTPDENAQAAITLLKDLPIDFVDRNGRALAEICFLTEDLLEDKLRPVN